ncbi:probable pectinesterase 29 [Malania oleifera]|uniref:probable pectinesterase 29 n=1 Tax=Malania oleifera TaxID=397392 RepID=UPI0025AE90D4|nr:probable pectinesterase 29 [Malania oleifera]
MSLQCQWLRMCALVVAFLGFATTEAAVGGRMPGYSIPTIVVDQSGRGNFTTIQAAIDAVPWGNSRWICIFVKSGLYKEKVSIPREKGFIYLKGEGRRKANVVWSDHDSIAQSPTFTSWADNVFARSISFTNSYNLPMSQNGNPRAPAVAAMIAGDKSSFYRCSFFGVQDTLWDFEGRHYFKSCTIVGAVDFIFGSGQSIYDGCTVAVTTAALGPGVPGYITAQGRSSPEQSNGFVFKNCRVVGNGLTYLGRPWRGYARVIFYSTYMSNIIVPQGWNAWYTSSREYQLTFVEYNCTGLGADTSRRVKWLSRLSTDVLYRLTRLDYIDSDGWLMSQPHSSTILA